MHFSRSLFWGKFSIQINLKIIIRYIKDMQIILIWNWNLFWLFWFIIYNKKNICKYGEHKNGNFWKFLRWCNDKWWNIRYWKNYAALWRNIIIYQCKVPFWIEIILFFKLGFRNLQKENLKLGSLRKLRFWQASYYFLSSSLFQNIIWIRTVLIIQWYSER